MQQHLHILQQTGAKWHYLNAKDILFSASYLHKHRHASTGCPCLESDSTDTICDAALKQSCNELECNKGQAIRYRKPSETVQACVSIGTVASADTVMGSGQHRDEIVQRRTRLASNGKPRECVIMFCVLLSRECPTMPTATRTSHGKHMRQQLEP